MEMKKNLFFSTLLLVTAVLMGGCRQEEPKTAPPTLSIEPAEALVFEATGGTRVIAVTTNQDTWRVLSDQTWCVAQAADDASFTVTAGINESPDDMPRAKVTVTAGTGNNARTVVLEVYQRGAEEVVPEEPPFGITLSNITATGVDMRVVPLDAAGSYYFDVIAKATLDEHHGGDIGRMMERMMAEAEQMYGSMEEALANLASRGGAGAFLHEALAGQRTCGFRRGARSRRCGEYGGGQRTVPDGGALRCGDFRGGVHEPLLRRRGLYRDAFRR